MSARHAAVEIPNLESPGVDVKSNPFVGPRPFTSGDTLYGRATELRELLALILTEGVVILYSVSGAGKTSLVQSSLVPKLKALRYDVLPPIRVSLQQPTSGEPRENRYLAGAALSLDEARPTWAAADLRESARRVTFQAYLEELRDLRGTRAATQMLIFDQLEEVLTLDPVDESEKIQFFSEVGTALRNSNCAALLVIREEWLGDLEQYLHLLSTGSAPARYRLGLLRPEAAREAIDAPARAKRVTFSEEALQKLIGDLRQIRTRKAGGGTEVKEGNFIEPVQLQVVCYRLWNDKVGHNERSDHDPWVTINADDIGESGGTETLLKDFYSEAVAKVARLPSGDERQIRERIQEFFIAPNGLRNQVLAADENTAGLPNIVLEALEDARILRREDRGGRMWYEITHDSFVNPILESNREWEERNATWLHQKARTWNATGRSFGALLPFWQYLRKPVLLRTASIESEVERAFLRQSRIRFLITLGIAIGVQAILLLLLGMRLKDRADDKAYQQYGVMIFEMENELYSRAMDEIIFIRKHGSVRGARETLVGLEVLPSQLNQQRSEARDRLPELRVLADPQSIESITFDSVSADRTAAALRQLGFAIAGSATEDRVANTVTFGESIPMDQIRLVLTQMVADSVFTRRVRRFRAGERTRDVEISYTQNVETWPPLTIAEIMRMKRAPLRPR
jgi:hypothetical protein